MIFNPELDHEEPLIHGHEELSRPSADIIGLGEKLNGKKEDCFNLVQFFDARRTWYAYQIL